jgi:Sigma-70 region 2/Winged helix-turn-helix DNA-binding
LGNIDDDWPPRGKDERNQFNENKFLAAFNKIPPLSEKEQNELLFRWREFKDRKARDRIVQANLRLVPPIAKATTKRFGFSGPSFITAWFELIGGGSLGLVNAVDGFDPKRGHKLEHYARRSIRNECIRAAKSLLSVVDRPYYAHCPRDIFIDPQLPDILVTTDYCGSRARPTQHLNDLDECLGSAHCRLRPWPEEHEVRFKKKANPIGSKIMDLRKAGLTLKEIADKLGMSTTTVWRREQAHIAEAVI